jgi:protocatechuate 3,4-dioxygenase, beta subunit
MKSLPTNFLKGVKLFLLLSTLSAPFATKAQNDKRVGHRCEGCEAVFEFGNRTLNAVDTLPDFSESGPKLEIRGTIYQRDGKTPAPNVILYVYHTNQKGIYPSRGDEKGWGKRHGYIRGWIKTGSDGKYRFYTLRPGAYPGRENPEHIHPVIKEPGYTAYYIDEYLFDDDPILTKEERNNQHGIGGKGIIKIKRGANGMQIAERDIILGLNVAGYD